MVKYNYNMLNTILGTQRLVTGYNNKTRFCKIGLLFFRPTNKNTMRNHKNISTAIVIDLFHFTRLPFYEFIII